MRLAERLFSLLLRRSGSQGHHAVSQIVGKLPEQGHFIRVEGVWFWSVNRNSTKDGLVGDERKADNRSKSPPHCLGCARGRNWERNAYP